MAKSKTRLCAVIGDPIAHSLSPVMHNAAFKALNLNYVYLAFQVKRGELKKAVDWFRTRGILGISVTLPHKVEIMKYIDSVDQLAEAIGAVNTIHNKDGKLLGYNTDGIGALNALKEKMPNLHGRKVLIVGAGGAARAIAFTLANEGVKLTILNRTGKKAITLAKSLQEKFGSPVSGFELENKLLRKSLAEADILINATQVGMSPKENETLVTRNSMKPNLAVFDIVYNPLKTKLLREAEAAGATTITGVKMLVYQGAEAFRIWTGHNPPIEVMHRAVIDELRRMK